MEPPGKPRKHLEGIAEQESLHQADEGGPQAEVACQGGFPVSWKEQACRGAPVGGHQLEIPCSKPGLSEAGGRSRGQRLSRQPAMLPAPAAPLGTILNILTGQLPLTSSGEAFPSEAESTHILFPSSSTPGQKRAPMFVKRHARDCLQHALHNFPSSLCQAQGKINRSWPSLGGPAVRNPPCNAGTQV